MRYVRRRAIVALIAPLLFSSVAALAQISPLAASDLLHQADFVGFVVAGPMSTDPTGTWRQTPYFYRVDPLKGSLVRNPDISNQYPFVHGDRAISEGYPTWYDEKGEYLVFLARDGLAGRGPWTTLAALPAEYRPDAAGRVTGRFSIGTWDGAAIGVDEMRALIRRAIVDSVAEARLDRTLRQAAERAFRERARRQTLSVEERLREAQRLAVTVRPGTLRSDIERIFPQEDGGTSGPGATRYYLGGEVMVEVTFDQTGGPWKPGNRVTGPLKVYRSYFHAD